MSTELKAPGRPRKGVSLEEIHVVLNSFARKHRTVIETAQWRHPIYLELCQVLRKRGDKKNRQLIHRRVQEWLGHSKKCGEEQGNSVNKPNDPVEQVRDFKAQENGSENLNIYELKNEDCEACVPVNPKKGFVSAPSDDFRGQSASGHLMGKSSNSKEEMLNSKELSHIEDPLPELMVTGTKHQNLEMSMEPGYLESSNDGGNYHQNVAYVKNLKGGGERLSWKGVDENQESFPTLDYFEFLDDAPSPALFSYSDSWSFFTSIARAKERRTCNEITIGVQLEEGGEFRFTNITPSDLCGTIWELPRTHFYEDLTMSESVRLHMLMEVNSKQDNDNGFVPILINYIEKVAGHLLDTKLGIKTTAEDFVVLRRKTSPYHTEIRIQHKTIFFRDLISLQHFIAFINQHVDETSKGVVYYYFLREQKPPVYLRSAALCVLSSELDGTRIEKKGSIEDVTVFESLLITRPSERGESLVCFSDLDLKDTLLDEPMKCEEIVAVFETKGSIFSRGAGFDNVLMWIFSKLHPQKSNIVGIQSFLHERVVNIFFEQLQCPVRKEGTEEHAAFVQIHIDSRVAYYLCNNSFCHERLECCGMQLIVHELDFIIPDQFYAEMRILVEEKYLKEYGRLDQAAVSSEYVHIPNKQVTENRGILYEEMQNIIQANEKLLQREAMFRRTTDNLWKSYEESRTKSENDVQSIPAENLNESSRQSRVQKNGFGCEEGSGATEESESPKGHVRLLNRKLITHDTEQKLQPTTEKKKSYFCPRKSKNKFSLVGSVVLTTEQWHNIWNVETNKLRKHFHMSTVARAFNQLGLFCVLKSNKPRVTCVTDGCAEIYTVKIYCYCGFADCRNFIITMHFCTVQLEPPTMFVEMCPCEMNHKCSCVGEHTCFRTRHCSGADRVTFKRTLKFMKPSMFRNMQLRAAKPEFLANRNTLDVYSDSVNRKMRSEEKQDGDLHHDPIFDVILKRRQQIKVSMKDKESSQQDKVKSQLDEENSQQAKESRQQDKQSSQLEKQNSQQEKENSQQDKQNSQQKKENNQQDKENIKQKKESSQSDNKTVQQDKENSQQNNESNQLGIKNGQSDKESSQLDKQNSQQEKESSELDKHNSQQEKENSRQDTENIKQNKKSSQLGKQNSQQEKESSQQNNESNQLGIKNGQPDKESSQLDNQDSQQEKESSELDKQNSQQEKENSQQDKENIKQNKKSSQLGKQNSQQEKENSYQDEENIKQNKESSQQEKENSQQDKENFKQNKETSQPDNKNCQQDKENSQPDKDNSQQDEKSVGAKNINSTKVHTCTDACKDKGNSECVHKDKDSHIFIQQAKEPFEIITHCHHRQILYKALKLAKKNGITVYFDSTGGIVDKVPCCPHRIYLYSLVVNINGIIVSLSDFFSCNHAVEYITQWLLVANRYYSGASKKPFAQHLVTDFSFALINAACIAINKVSLDIYLNGVYSVRDSEAGKAQFMKMFCILHLCYSHLSKSFTDTIVEQYKTSVDTIALQLSKEDRREIAKVLKNGLLLINVERSYESIKEIFRHLFTLLLTPYKNEHVKNTLEWLEKKCDDTSEEKNLDVDETGSKERADGIAVELKKVAGDVIYENIGFYKDILVVFNEVEAKASEVVKKESEEKKNGVSSDPNIFKNKQFAIFLLVNYAHILPLWSGLFTSEGDEFHNANVENYFNLVKHFMREDGDGKDKIGRVLDRVEDYHIAKAIAVNYGIPKEGLTGKATAPRRKNQKRSLEKGNTKQKIKTKKPKMTKTGIRRKRPVGPKKGSALSKKKAEPKQKKPSQQKNTTDIPKKRSAGNRQKGKSKSNKKSLVSADIRENTTSTSELPLEELCANNQVNPVSLKKDDTERNEKEEEKAEVNGDSAYTAGKADDKVTSKVLTNGVELIDAYDLTVKEFWLKSRRSSLNLSSPVTLRNIRGKRKREEEHEIRSKSEKKAEWSSRLSIKLANQRRSMSEHDPTCEDTFEDFILDYLNKTLFVINHPYYYELLDQKVFQDGREDCVWFYPITKHTLLQKSVPKVTKDGFKRYDIIHTSYWSDFCHFRTSKDVKNTTQLMLTNSNIDTTVAVFARNLFPDFCKSVNIFSCITALKVIEGTSFSRKDVQDNHLSKEIKYVILPFNNEGNHWCLLIVDVQDLILGQKRKYWYLDPLGSISGYDKPSPFIFLGILSKICPNVKNGETYERVSIRHPAQKDGYNCGVFILFFIECFLKQSGSPKYNLPLRLIPDEYRIYVSNLLLQHTLPMENMCLTCGNNIVCDKWIQCDYCCRWAHQLKDCVDNPEVDWDQLEQNPDDTDFLCKLCKVNKEHYDSSKVNYYTKIYKQYLPSK